MWQAKAANAANDVVQYPEGYAKPNMAEILDLYDPKLKKLLTTPQDVILKRVNSMAYHKVRDILKNSGLQKADIDQLASDAGQSILDLWRTRYLAGQ